MEYLNVQIQTQSDCNGGCAVCPHWKSDYHKNPVEMETITAAKVIRQLAMSYPNQIKRGKICVYLMNEPLMDKGIVALIETAYAWFEDDVHIELSTNAILLDYDMASKLIEVFARRRHSIWISHPYECGIMRGDRRNNCENIASFVRRSRDILNVTIRSGFHKGTPISGGSLGGLEFSPFYFHNRAESKTSCQSLPVKCDRVTNWLHIDAHGDYKICCMDYHNKVKLPNIKDMSIPEYMESKERKQLIAWMSGTESAPDDFICRYCTSPGG